MTNFLIDIGNSNCKVAFEKEGKLIKILRNSNSNLNTLEYLLSVIDGYDINIIVLSTVKEDDPYMEEILSDKCKKLVVLNSETKLPIDLKYGFPDETLGADRRAGALAVAMLFPGENCIKFDFGTALTIDFINNDGEYCGGNISIGMQSRLNALNMLTKRLPLITPDKIVPSMGVDTSGAMTAGVVLGLKFEVEGYIKRYPNHTIIFTGGDSCYFAKKIKSSVFVVKNLVLMGLALIADYYADCN